MLYVVVATALENVQETDNVAIDIGVRILDRVAHARLCGEVNDLVELLFGKQRFHRLAIGEIDAGHFERVVVVEDRRA